MAETMEKPPLPDSSEIEAKKIPEEERVLDSTEKESIVVEEQSPAERETVVLQGLDIIRTHLTEYFSVESSETSDEKKEVFDVRAALKELFPENGKEAEEMIAIEGLLAAIRNRYTELSGEGENVQGERTRFTAEFGELLAFVEMLEKSPEGVTSTKETKRPPTMRECLETIKKFLADRLVSLAEPLEEREESDSAAEAEGDDDYYDDDTDIESPVEPKAQTSTEAPSEETEEESALEGREFVFTKDQEVIWEDPFTVVTEEPKQIERWKKMLTQELVRGRIVATSSGAAILHIDFQPLPWFVTGRKEFVKKNRKYEALFPGSFDRIHKPGTDGEYLPEPIFFDRTGKAMNMFLAGRWDEYVESSEYRTYELKRAEE